MDYASSAPTDRGVLRVMRKAESEIFANPGSLHHPAVLAKKAVEESRIKIANVLGAHKDEIIFTGSGTESNNLAVLGITSYVRHRKPMSDIGSFIPHIISSNIEHSSILEALKILEKEGVEVSLVSVDADGFIDHKEIKKLLKSNTVLVSIMYANNEIGTIQSIREIAKEIRHFKRLDIKNPKRSDLSVYPLFHTDATQAMNYLPINVEKLGVDLMTWNGPKIYGPKGIGGLYVRRNTPIAPIMGGGGQEFGLRAGTENVPAIIGFAKALEIAEKVKEKEVKRLTSLRDYFLLRFDLNNWSKAVLNGSIINRLPNNLNITISGIESELLVIELDAKGIYVSSKSACKNYETDESTESYVIEVLRKASGSKVQADGIRFSLGRDTKKEDIDHVIKSLKKILNKLKKWYID